MTMNQTLIFITTSILFETVETICPKRQPSVLIFVRCKKICRTHFRKDNVIVRAALRAADAHAAPITIGPASSLPLVQPALETRLMDPFGAAFTPAWTQPLGAVIVAL